MVAELSARHALRVDVVDDVAARTGGVPLFVEEVTRLLLERGDQGALQSIPPTLQQSLMARLDRLGPAREVAQIGSVIGRGFSYELLRAVAEMDDAQLQAALERLAEADIVLVQGVPPERDYRFKHALIQDAAYENLLKSRRQVLHRRMAEILRDRFAAAAETEPEVLAHHFTQAGLTDVAIEWWGKAGDQALRRSAFEEAIAHLGKAIEMADKSAGAAPKRNARGRTGKAADQFRHCVNCGTRRWRVGDDDRLRACPGAGSRGRRPNGTALSQLRPLGRVSQPRRGSPVAGNHRSRLARHRGQAAVARSRRRAPHCGHDGVDLGNFALARTHLEQTLAMFDPQRDHDLTYRFGRDMGVSAMVFMALTLWPLGETEQARRIGEEALARAAASGHMLTTVYGHFQYALLHVARRDAATTAPLAEAVREVGARTWHGALQRLWRVPAAVGAVASWRSGGRP